MKEADKILSMLVFRLSSLCAKRKERTADIREASNSLDKRRKRERKKEQKKGRDL